MLPATEAAAAARREVVDDFAVAVFGGEAQRDLPVWSDQRVIAVVDFHEELDEGEVSDGGGDL